MRFRGNIRSGKHVKTTDHVEEMATCELGKGASV